MVFGAGRESAAMLPLLDSIATREFLRKSLARSLEEIANGNARAGQKETTLRGLRLDLSLLFKADRSTIWCFSKQPCIIANDSLAGTQPQVR